MWTKANKKQVFFANALNWSPKIKTIVLILFNFFNKTLFFLNIVQLKFCELEKQKSKVYNFVRNLNNQFQDYFFNKTDFLTSVKFKLSIF